MTKPVCDTGYRPFLCAATGYLVLILLLYPGALLTSDILCQADVLFQFEPWRSAAPAEFAGPANGLLSDQSLQFLPYQTYFRDAVLSGRWPLWNPHIMFGTPFAGNLQAGVWFPLTWLIFIFGVPEAQELIVAGKLLLCGLGIFVFCWRSLGFSPAASFCGGVVLALGGYMTVWSFSAGSSVLMSAGWILYWTERVFTRPGGRRAAALALVTAIGIAGGHPETVLYLGLLVALWLLVLFLSTPGRRLKQLLRPLLSALLGAALCGALLFPFFELTLDSATLQMRSEARFGAGYLPLLAAGELLIPRLFGDPADSYYVYSINFNEITGFGGVASLFLALVLLGRGRCRGSVYAFTALGLSLCIVYGIPPFPWLWGRLPFFRESLNTTLLMGINLSLALLSAWGIDSLTARRDIVRSRRVVSAASALGLLGTAAILSARPLHADWSALVVPVLLFYLTLAAVATLSWCCFRFPGARGLTAAWVLLICTEMLAFARGYVPTIPRSWYPLDRVPGVVQWLSSAGPERFVGIDSGNLIQNTSMVYGLYDFRGYDLPEPSLYHHYFRRLDPEHDFDVVHRLPAWNPAWIPHLQRASVRYLLSREPIDHPRLRLAARRELYIYDLQDASPRVRAEPVEAAGADSGSVPAAGETIEGGSDERGIWEADLVRYEPERVEVEVHCSRACRVILTDLAYPGWKAEVDGNAEPIRIADETFRAVELPSGRHRVVMEYRPLSVKIGAAVSLLALLTLLGLIATGES